jgi:hypothetical protein
VGVPAWVWFAIAAVAAMLGSVLLLRDRARMTSRNRERHRWAALRGWQFAETDHVLPTQWTSGAIAYFGGGLARDVVAGSTFTADGRRRVYVFDLDVGSKIGSVIAAVQCRRTQPVVVELWLPNVPFQREHMPELLGPVGQRYAFVSDIASARAMITPDLVDAIEDIGADIPVVWIEGGWVLASAPPSAGPSRLERLLRSIGEVADVVDPFDAEIDPVGDQDQQTGKHGEPGEVEKSEN